MTTIARFDAAPEPGRHYRTRPGAYAIMIRDRQVMLTLQARPVREFQLPGGGIDPGESPLQALHREAREETGWRIDVKRRLGAFRRFAYMPEYDLWAEKICIVYLARPVCRTGAPVEPDHSAHWMSPQDAVERLGNPGDRFMLSRFLGAPSGRGAGRPVRQGARGRARPGPR